MGLIPNDQEEQQIGGPWPAFADLLAATTLLFLILFAAVAVPAISRAKEADARRNTLLVIDSVLAQVTDKPDSLVTSLRVGDYLSVRITGEATFPLNRYELADLKPEGRRILREIGEFLKGSAVMDSIDQIQVVGHTSAEGSDERNWILSASRAATVSLFLIDSVGVPPCRVSALGRSRYFPVDPANARTGVINPQDRRIELEIRPIVPTDTVQAQQRERCVDRGK